MADKKITALTALGSGDPDPAVDLLHIIDYSASPVNKKITVANLFSRVDTDTTIVGASKTFEVEHAVGTSALEVLTNTAAASSESTVTVNKDSSDFVDFAVNSTGGAAISVDASTDDITINSGSIAAMDLTVNGDNGVNLYSDGGLDCVGIGTGTVDGTVTATIAADGTTGHAASLAGNLLLTGVETVTPAANAAQAIGLTTPVTRYTTPASGTNDLTIADGTAGQIKHIVTVNTGGGNGVLNSANVAGAEAITLQHEGDSVILWYDTTTTLWFALGTHATGAGS